jgi:hypothetical protein
MPYRRTIVSVFGRPIPCPKVEKPTMDKVLEVHTLYVEELKRYDQLPFVEITSTDSTVQNMGQVQR